MEDVLRKIYLKKHQDLQKRRIDRLLNIDEPRRHKQLYKNIFEDYLPLTQNFDLENQLKIKKQIQHGNNFLQDNHRYKIKSVTSPFISNQQNNTSLPPINRKFNANEMNVNQFLSDQDLRLQLKNPQRFKARKKQIETKLKIQFLFKRFRIRVHTIVFISKLKALTIQTLRTKRQSIQQFAPKLLQVIQKMINKYYVSILEQQLLKYLELIKIKIQQPKIMLEKQILNLLFFMSKQLAKSTVIRELMDFLLIVSQNRSFFPNDYLTPVQACRLQFNPKYGCIQNLSQKQTKMIIAVCVGLKIFCAYILYRPWLLQIQKSPISPHNQTYPWYGINILLYNYVRVL